MSKVLKKILCLIFALLTLTACLIVPASAAYENTYKNTGDQRKDIVGVAKTQIGNTNASRKYRSDSAAWCASFVVWCARQAGIDASIIKNSGYATADDLGVSYKGRSADRKTGINYTPQPGDLIFFDWQSNGFCYKSPASFYGDHVGIVIEVRNGQVYTVEGNSNGAVRERSYSLSDVNIKGYGVPAYKNTTKASTPVVTMQTVNFRFKSGAYTNAYDSFLCTNKVGRVYTGDVVTVQAVISTSNDTVLQLSCPWTGGINKIVYCRATELKFKADKYINAYAGQSTSNKVGRIYPGDICNILAVNPGSGYLLCACPWDSGGMKQIYVKYSEIY